MRRLARRRPRMRRLQVLGHARLAAQRAYRDRGCESDAAEADHDCCDAAGALSAAVAAVAGMRTLESLQSRVVDGTGSAGIAS